ncbi:SctK family type III secretion system sorting platform protein [Motilimonas pumila]|nr:SctK family type III secretion system sorting platform protein [Motilimonas pumila]
MTLNFQPLDWVHSEWLEDVPFLQQCQTFNSPAIQQHVRQQLKLNNVSDSQFSDPIKRLIFLPQDTLLQLVNLIGLSCFQKQVKLLIEKEIKQQICDLVTPQGLTLIQKKLPLLVSKYPDSLVTQAPLYDRKSKQLAQFHAYGFQLLSLAIEHSQQDWLKLLSMKLPKCDTLPEFRPAALNQTEQSRLRLLIQKIAVEIDPQCTTLLK